MTNNSTEILTNLAGQWAGDTTVKITERAGAYSSEVWFTWFDHAAVPSVRVVIDAGEAQVTVYSFDGHGLISGTVVFTGPDAIATVGGYLEAVYGI